MIFKWSSVEQRKLTDHLESKGCLGFVVEFNIYSITGDESHVAYLSLAGSVSNKLLIDPVPQIVSL